MTPARPPGPMETLNGQQPYCEVHGTGEPLLLLHGFSGSSQDWIPSLAQWGTKFQLILPDLRGHGRSGILSKPFRHEDAATDMFALLDHLGIHACKGVGISAGGNVLLHMAVAQPERLTAMVLVSATPYFPLQARTIMAQYPDNLPEEQWEILRRRHPGGDEQIKAIFASAKSFATSYDDLNSRLLSLRPFKPAHSPFRATATLSIPSSIPSKCSKPFPTRVSGSFPTPAMAPSSALVGPSSCKPRSPSCRKITASAFSSHISVYNLGSASSREELLVFVSSGY